MHKLVAYLWVEAGADKGEDRQLLHLLFICCGKIKINTPKHPGESLNVTHEAVK